MLCSPLSPLLLVSSPCVGVGGGVGRCDALLCMDDDDDDDDDDGELMMIIGIGQDGFGADL